MDSIECIDEKRLARLVGRFYAKVRADELIGPVFNDAIDDWPEHLEQLAAFWSSLIAEPPAATRACRWPLT